MRPESSNQNWDIQDFVILGCNEQHNLMLDDGVNEAVVVQVWPVEFRLF